MTPDDIDLTRVEHPPQRSATIRVSDTPGGGVRLEISSSERTDVHTVDVDTATFIDARDCPEVFWRSVARRMDDAHNAGEPLWSRLTRQEVEALCADDVDTVPESASTLGVGGRIATDPRVHTSW